mgnify:FL=1
MAGPSEGEQVTLYHLWFGQLAAERVPTGGSVETEPRISEGPLRADYLLLRKARPANDAGIFVRLWQLIPRHALIEYKSPGRPPGPDVLDQLLAYAHQLRRARWPAMGDAGDLAVVLVTASITPSVRVALGSLGMQLCATEGAYTEVRGSLFPMWVVSLDDLAGEEREPLLTFFARGKLDPSAKEARRWMRARMSSTDTTDLRDLEGYDEALKAMIQDLPPEERLEGLTPEERVRGLDPEERVRGLDPEERLEGLTPEERVRGLAPEERVRGLAPEERVLTLPVEALRALASEYVDSLPEPVRAEVRRRLREA